MVQSNSYNGRKCLFCFLFWICATVLIFAVGTLTRTYKWLISTIHFPLSAHLIIVVDQHFDAAHRFGQFLLHVLSGGGGGGCSCDIEGDQ